MEFNGNEGEEFPLDNAVQWTANYRKANPKGIKAHFFGTRLILRILGQPNCVGLRTYYALDDSGVQQMIIVGVDKDMNDLYKGIIGERSMPCPNYCDDGKSPLNG